MSYEYNSTIEWSNEESVHGEIKMDCGYECTFHKPVEFGGEKGVLNPEDAFVGSLAMCFSITFQEMANKMRLDINAFKLNTKGVLEEGKEGKEFTKIFLQPIIISGEPESKLKRALELSKKNCLISRSMKSEIILQPKFQNK